MDYIDAHFLVSHCTLVQQDATTAGSESSVRQCVNLQ